MKYPCEICGKEFDTFQEKGNHIRWKHERYDNNAYSKKLKKSAEKANERRFGKWVEEKVECSNPNCKKEVLIKYREGKKLEKYFCSRSCANIRDLSINSKKKISEGIKRSWKDGKYDTEEYWEKQRKNKKFSSAIEREIINHFKNKYPGGKWKSGGSIIVEGERIVRDLWSDDLKICFEYDGIWHFKDINGQLEKKQKKDKLLEKWCIENKYRLIRVDEENYINMEQIESLIFERTEPIIKIGKRYKRSSSKVAVE